MVSPELDSAGYRAFFEEAAQGMLLVSAHGTLLDANREARKALGYGREELRGMALREVLDPRDPGSDVSIGREARREIELRFLRRDGGSLPVEVSLLPLSDGADLLGVVFRPDGIGGSQAPDEAAVGNGSDLITLCNADNTIRRVSPSVEHVLGYRPEEVEGKFLPDLVHPDDLVALATGGTERGPNPVRYRHKDGSWVYLESVATNLLDDPDVRGTVVDSRYVAGGMRTGEEIKGGPKAQYKDFPVPTYLWREEAGGDFVLVDHNDAAYEFTRGHVVGLLGKRATEVAPDGSDLVERLSRCAQQRKSDRWETRWTLEATGELKDLVMTCVFVPPDLVMVHTEDVTERRRAEADLRESEERFRSLVRYVSDIVTIVDRDGTVLYESPAVERALGFRPEERVGEYAFDRVHPDDVGWVRRKLAGVSKEAGGRSSMWYRVRNRRGEWRHFEAVATNLLHDPRIRGIVLTTRDITERKQAQERLREAEERYRTLVETIPAVTYIQEPDEPTSRTTYISPQYETMLGYSTEESLRNADHWVKILHPDDRERVLAEDRRTNETGEPFSMEYRVLHKEGRVIWVRDEAVLIAGPEGRPPFWQGVMSDITDRKRMEEDLRRSLDGMVALHEASKVLVSSLDLEEIGPRLLEIMRRVANLSAAVIELRDEQGEPRLLFAAGPEGTWRLAREASGAREARRAAVETGEPRSFRTGRPGEDLPPAGLCLPMRVRGRLIGTVEAYGPHTLTDRKTVEFLGSLAGHAGSTFENARLYQDLAERERRLEELLGKLIAAQEEERRRVAYEVHDGFAHVAVAAHQRLQAFARRHPPASREGEADLDRALGLVQRAVREARRTIANLRPTALDDLGLAAAIRLEIEDLRGDGWHVDYEENIGDERLPAAVETAVYRVAQEALTNVRKHARTRRALLELLERDGKLCLRIEDRGRGFDPADLVGEVRPGERVGISGMRERISLLGGKLEVRSRPGEGTLVVAEIPIPARAEAGS